MSDMPKKGFTFDNSDEMYEEVLRLQHLVATKDAEIEQLKAENAELRREIGGFQHLSDMRQCMIDTADENERLKKVADQAVKIGRVGFRGYYGEGAKWMYDYDKLENDACGITSYKCAEYPELAAWLKEKENGNN